MPTVTLTLPSHLEEALRAAALADVESAGVLIASIVNMDEEIRLLGRRIRWVPDDAYAIRAVDGLLIEDRGWVPAFAGAFDVGAVPLFVHTHPEAPPNASHADRTVAQQLDGVASNRGEGRPYGTLVVSASEQGISFTGELHLRGGRPIELLRTIGDRLRFRTAHGLVAVAPVPEVFDRSIRAFGSDMQRILGRLRLGVVGHGGTGSAVTELLIRLGVGEVVVLDDQALAESNVARVYGAGRSAVGRPKVTIAEANARRIGLGTRVTPVPMRVTDRRALRLLRGCDVVFGCTDDHAGRAILSRFAFWYLVPVIDLGLLISSRGGTISGIDGRITTILPGAPCMLCRGAIDPARMRFEALQPEERARLAAEGYAPELGDPDPAVVVHTTMVATFAVNELLERLIGFGGAEPPSELLIRVHEREISRNRRVSRPGCFCADPDRWALGDDDPALGLSWPT